MEKTWRKAGQNSPTLNAGLAREILSLRYTEANYGTKNIYSLH